VIAVGAGTGSDCSEKIAGHDGICVGTADPHWCFSGDSTRPHHTNPATNTLSSEATLRQLSFKSVPGVLLACFGHVTYHFLCRFVGTALS